MTPDPSPADPVSASTDSAKPGWSVLETDSAKALQVLANIKAMSDLQKKARDLENEMAYAIALPHIQRAISARDFMACAPFLNALDMESERHRRLRDHVARAMSMAPSAQVPLTLWANVFSLNEANAIRFRQQAKRL